MTESDESPECEVGFKKDKTEVVFTGLGVCLTLSRSWESAVQYLERKHYIAGRVTSLPYICLGRFSQCTYIPPYHTYSRRQRLSLPPRFRSNSIEAGRNLRFSFGDSGLGGAVGVWGFFLRVDVGGRYEWIYTRRARESRDRHIYFLSYHTIPKKQKLIP